MRLEQVLDLLMESFVDLDGRDKRVLLAIVDLMLRRAELRGFADPFGLPLPVTISQMHAALPGLPVGQFWGLLEGQRLAPATMRLRGNTMSTAAGQGVALFDIVRTQLHVIDDVKPAWWVRMGLWSRLGLTNEERYFIARALVAWSRATSEEVAKLVRVMALKMAESRFGVSGPIKVQPILRDFICNDPAIRKISPGDALSAVHALEEAGLVICPTDVAQDRRRHVPLLLDDDMQSLFVASPDSEV